MVTESQNKLRPEYQERKNMKQCQKAEVAKMPEFIVVKSSVNRIGIGYAQ